MCTHCDTTWKSMRINIYLKIIEINKYYIYNTNESSGKLDSN